MAAIRPLPESVRRQLRSGAVVSSLAQLCEELICNSIDAGATEVVVHVDTDRISIRVDDNGIGMSREDVALLGSAHATSKLSSMLDLNSGPRTLGFRGEAMHSIMSFSLVDITTRQRDCVHTYRKVSKGGEVLSMGMSSQTRKPGTTVLVKDIFFNQPVRRRQLVTRISKEFLGVRDRLVRLALVRPRIFFKLTAAPLGANLALPAASSAPERLKHLTGEEWNLEKIDHRAGSLRVSGYVSRADKVGLLSPVQYIYVNRRFVSSSALQRLLKRKFLTCFDSSGLSLGLQCSYIINIECLPSEYDITFDPDKTYVEFKDWQSILSAMEGAVQTVWKPHSGSPFTEPGILSKDVTDLTRARQRETRVLEPAAFVATPQLASEGPGFPGDQGLGPFKLRRVDCENLEQHDVLCMHPGIGDPVQSEPRLPARDHVGDEMFCEQRTPFQLTSGLGMVDGEAVGNDWSISTPEHFNHSSPPGARCSKPLESPLEWMGLTKCQQVKQPGTPANGKASPWKHAQTKRPASPAVGKPSAKNRRPSGPEQNGAQATSEGNDSAPLCSPLLAQPTTKDLCQAWKNAGKKHDVHALQVPEVSAKTRRLHGFSAVTETVVSSTVSRKSLQKSIFIRQIGSKFLCVRSCQDILLVDQHAADERVLLEELRDQVINAQLPQDRTLLSPPLSMHMGPQEVLALETWKDKAEWWGWSFTPGTTRDTLTLYSVPNILGVTNAGKEDLLEYAQQLVTTQGSCSAPPAVNRLLSSKACRGAIMFGDSLLVSQCQELLDHLKKTKLPHQCAHGRPTSAPVVHLGKFKSAIAAVAKQRLLVDSFHGLRHLEISLSNLREKAEG